MATKSSHWQAWLDTMPPSPHTLHVIGDIEVGNPGVEAFLTVRVPQGFIAENLLLDLSLVQRPGVWIQQVSCVQVHFTRVLSADSPKYTSVTVYAENETVADIKVKEIS